MAEVNDGDVKLLDAIEAARCREIYPRESAKRLIAEYRQSCEDAIARKAFAAVCEHCEAGVPAWTSEHDGSWRHDKGNDGKSVCCEADILRDELDPLGRLSGPRDVDEGDASREPTIAHWLHPGEGGAE